MGKLDQLIAKRSKKGREPSSKMSQLAELSNDGNRSSFAGVFSVGELNDDERTQLRVILESHTDSPENLERDLADLATITSEVKAINNQAAILHGERIKRAQQLFRKYHDGAFSAWLVTTYGNRQTPYNFLQYYEFYNAMPKLLRPQIERMPRQAIYTLASRDGDLKQKQQIVEKYEGQTKDELIRTIRDTFPLAVHDQRRQDFASVTLQGLRRLLKQVGRSHIRMSSKQREEYDELIGRLQAKVKS